MADLPRLPDGLRMSRPKLRSASRKVAEEKITKLVSDSEALEVVRPGRFRNILPACRLNILEKGIVGVEAGVQMKKSTVGTGTGETIRASENYFDENGERCGENDVEHEKDFPIPINTFTIGDIVDVTVCLAISPSYFIIQTNSSALELEELSIDMFCFYEEEEGGVMVELDRRKKGKVVAVRHEEGDWYRARITEVLTDNHMMVRLLDYGDLEMVEAMDMRILGKQFMVLPAQAVNARLAGVMPARGDWGREEEDWWGRRVEGGMFVAQVGESWEAGGDLGLELLMYDTSKEDDIVLQEEMVQLGMAMYIQTF